MQDVESSNEGKHIKHGQAVVYPVAFGEHYKTAISCCDCNLIHLVEITHDSESVTLRFYRDDEATDEARHSGAEATAKVMGVEWVDSRFAKITEQ
jgi:hypothetical protein